MGVDPNTAETFGGLGPAQQDTTQQLVMQLLGMSAQKPTMQGMPVQGMQDLTGRTTQFNAWAQKALKQSAYYKSMGVKNFINPSKALLYQQQHGGIPGMSGAQLGNLLAGVAHKKTNVWGTPSE